ncbi:MAG: MFS transporter [Chloroflexi bacterium]|nr:MFS transporter [Chloroflexota bacterium]
MHPGWHGPYLEEASLKDSGVPQSGKHPFPFFYGWAIVAAASATIGLTAGISNAQGVFVKPLQAEFGWTRATVAGALAISNIIAAILAPFMGQLADKYGPRAMIAVCGLFTGGAYLLMSGVGALWQFYLIFAIFLAVGNSANWGTVGPTVSRWFFAKRGLAQGIVQAGAGLGTIIFPPLATYLILTRNWRYAYIVLGLLIVLLVGGMAFIYRRRPQDIGLAPDGRPAPIPEPGAATIGSGSGPLPVANKPGGATVSMQHEMGFTFRQAMGTRSFRLLAFIALAASFVQQMMLLHLVPHATDVGFSPAVAATFMSVLGVTNIVGKITMGTVSDHIGRRNSLIISFGLAAAMLFWLLVARSSWSLYLFAAVYGFAYGSWIPMFPAIASDLFGLGSLGAIYGAVMASNSIGGALGAFLGGHIFDVTESYDYAFLTASALLMAGIVCLLVLRLPGNPRRAEG